MIAAPEGGDIRHRLSWEKEEGQIIRAFEKLYENADVQIDFTADGSLESLERKLKENHYHILHFSGHGIYKGEKGYLALEDPITMKQQLVAAEDLLKPSIFNLAIDQPLCFYLLAKLHRAVSKKGSEG